MWLAMQGGLFSSFDYLLVDYRNMDGGRTFVAIERQERCNLNVLV